MKELKDYITNIPDFPQKGIIFRDVTSVLQDADGLKLAIDSMQKNLEGLDFDVIVGAESRGFVFGMPLAGKLPRETIEQSYDLEYGTATLEMHKDAIKRGQKVVIVDDLIATGGTAEAMIELVEKLGGEVVQLNFLIELKDLNGREKLKNYDVKSAVVYSGK